MAILALATDLQDLRAADRPHHRRRDRGRTRRDARGPQGRRRHDGPAARRHQAQPRADRRGRAGLRARRPVRQHRPRQLVGRGRSRGAQAQSRPSARRVASRRTWASRSSWTSSAGSRRPATVRGRHRGHHPCPQDARRRGHGGGRPAARPGAPRGGSGGRPSRCGEPRAARRDRGQLRRPGRRRHQRLPRPTTSRSSRRCARWPWRPVPRDVVVVAPLRGGRRRCPGPRSRGLGGRPAGCPGLPLPLPRRRDACVSRSRTSPRGSTVRTASTLAPRAEQALERHRASGLRRRCPCAWPRRSRR